MSWVAAREPLNVLESSSSAPRDDTGCASTRIRIGLHYTYITGTAAKNTTNLVYEQGCDTNLSSLIRWDLSNVSSVSEITPSSRRESFGIPCLSSFCTFVYDERGRTGNIRETTVLLVSMSLSESAMACNWAAGVCRVRSTCASASAERFLAGDFGTAAATAAAAATTKGEGSTTKVFSGRGGASFLALFATPGVVAGSIGRRLAT